MFCRGFGWLDMSDVAVLHSCIALLRRSRFMRMDDSRSPGHPHQGVSAILAGSWRDRAGSTRYPRSRYLSSWSLVVILVDVTTGGIGARSGVDAVRTR
jgi:hypothetical protein